MENRGIEQKQAEVKSKSKGGGEQNGREQQWAGRWQRSCVLDDCQILRLQGLGDDEDAGRREKIEERGNRKDVRNEEYERTVERGRKR